MGGGDDLASRIRRQNEEQDKLNAIKKREGSQGLRVAAEQAILGNNNQRPKPRVNLVELMKDPDSLNIINEAPRHKENTLPPLQHKPPLQP